VLIGQSLPPVTTSIYKIRKMIKNERIIDAGFIISDTFMAVKKSSATHS
jgi:hypothetical protein